MGALSGSNDVLAVIIGRAGSKGLPGKNALSLGGRPLVAWTLDDARRADSVDRILVTTDCPHVAAAAVAAGVDVVDRPAELATDEARVDDAVRHAVTTRDDSAELIVILYANVPVRPVDLIDRAVELVRTTGATSAQSYADVVKYHPWWMVRADDDGRVHRYEENTSYRRQDLPPLLIPDGGVIVVRREPLLAAAGQSSQSFLGDDQRVVHTARGDVIDIDDRFDLLVAETALRARTGSTHQHAESHSR